MIRASSRRMDRSCPQPPHGRVEDVAGSSKRCEATVAAAAGGSRGPFAVVRFRCLLLTSGLHLAQGGGDRKPGSAECRKQSSKQTDEGGPNHTLDQQSGRDIKRK